MYKIESIIQTCYAAPTIFDGKTESGETFYIRYRWGQLRLNVNDECIVVLEVGDSLDGVIDQESALKHLSSYISW